MQWCFAYCTRYQQTETTGDTPGFIEGDCEDQVCQGEALQGPMSRITNMVSTCKANGCTGYITCFGSFRVGSIPVQRRNGPCPQRLCFPTAKQDTDARGFVEMRARGTRSSRCFLREARSPAPSTVLRESTPAGRPGIEWSFAVRSDAFAPVSGKSEDYFLVPPQCPRKVERLLQGKGVPKRSKHRVARIAAIRVSGFGGSSMSRLVSLSGVGLATCMGLCHQEANGAQSPLAHAPISKRLNSDKGCTKGQISLSCLRQTFTAGL